MKLMSILTVALLAICINPEADSALIDRARFPLAEQHCYYYLTTSTVAPKDRERLISVLRFVVPSLSSKSYLADQIPQRVAGTNLLRLNLVGLGWENTYPIAVKKVYPYRPDLDPRTVTPLVVDGLWFAANAMDPIEAPDLQYQLLYNGKPPKNRDEFLKFWGIGNEPELLFGLIAEESGVNVSGLRQIESRPASKRNYGWGTADSSTPAGKFDPLESFTSIAKLPHTAEEWLVGIPKATSSGIACLQACWLSTDKGVKQDKAPADIVEDSLRLRGGVEIRNTSGCIGCHPKGITEPTLDKDKKNYADGFRRYIQSGARVGFLEKDRQRGVDLYFGSKLQREILHHQSLYEAGVAACNGETGTQNSLNYMAMVRLYDADVDLEQAGRELYWEPRHVRLGIADYGRRYADLTGRLALMPQGIAMSRKQWIENFPAAQRVMDLWSR